MTEKRFTMKGSTILECGEEITAWDCCDLLNELHEKNEHLKAEVYILQDDILNKRVRNLIKENKQLKQKNQLLYEDIDFLKRFIEKRGFKAELESDKND